MKIKMTDVEKASEAKAQLVPTKAAPTKIKRVARQAVRPKRDLATRIILFAYHHQSMYLYLVYFMFFTVCFISYKTMQENSGLRSDLVTLKHRLADRDGIEFLRKMSEINEDLPQYLSVMLETRKMEPDGTIHYGLVIVKNEDAHPYISESGEYNGLIGDQHDEDTKPLKRFDFSDFSNDPQGPLPSANGSNFGFNAANAIKGAFIVEEQSSETVSFGDEFMDQVSNTLGDVDSGFVILDRDDIPSDKAWCSNEKNPILTIRLSSYIIPSGVSYQHAKWNNGVPDGAPELYDVVACLNPRCNETVLLVSNCEYKSGGEMTSMQQDCPVDKQFLPINKVQIRFRENHGNVDKTCAFLIRVHGKPISHTPQRNEVDKAEEEQAEYHKRHLSVKTSPFTNCTEAAWFYKTLPPVYHARRYTCPILYAENCCVECPGCCSTCRMKPGISNNILRWIVSAGILTFPIFLMAIMAWLYIIVSKMFKRHKRQK